MALLTSRESPASWLATLRASQSDRAIALEGSHSMKALYLPYDISFDAESKTYCLTGRDRHGKIFGVGSGPSVELAQQRLRDYILESLCAAADDSQDYTVDLLRRSTDENCLLFSVLELLPIRIRLQRALSKLRQVDVAERMGISQQAYAKLEKPGSNPTLKVLSLLEQAFKGELLEMV